MSQKIETHELTILLTLKNRHEYTKTWLDQNIFPEFSYLIADGSDSDLNQKICLSYVSENIRYIRYPPDVDYRIYMKKRMSALSQITTRYVLYADNDDFLLRDGLNKIISEFKACSDINLIQGSVGKVEKVKNGSYIRTADWPHFLVDDESGLVKIKKCLANHYSLWYSISEVSLQRKIFNVIYLSGTENPYLVEEFQTYLSLAMAKTKVVSCYYYVRLDNPASSNHLSSFNKHRYDQILNINYHNSFVFLVGELAKYCREIDKDSLFNSIREYQLSKFKNLSLVLKLIIVLKTWFNKNITNFFKRKIYSSDKISSLFI